MAATAADISPTAIVAAMSSIHTGWRELNFGYLSSCSASEIISSIHLKFSTVESNVFSAKNCAGCNSRICVDSHSLRNDVL
ncbi:hypothetical protein L2E82_16729 [Cichorium intybus]|uniref:Uncharacterized protein n=1 Tax=Cichorium intybus TaxID=13427 RepID=A0ACB9F6W4_CICIN|nr:hypothetical protein L2E82_16729 [Cichorium intybus]